MKVFLKVLLIFIFAFAGWFLNSFTIDQFDRIGNLTMHGAGLVCVFFAMFTALNLFDKENSSGMIEGEKKKRGIE
ncbi:hypothetical protein [Falsibacillus pallidus]|uniref:Uncharacterized protein n=1 Tax=Falsibacillus pallidus TaxID=493781 RepID=A0A370GAW1_9BACI|nr:hypothetical protein [Falsibacillus pallidus]RDI39133.1 hypothetical protein DFR59_11540 [Falsibacillus pallidus]